MQDSHVLIHSHPLLIRGEFPLLFVLSGPNHRHHHRIGGTKTHPSLRKDIRWHSRDKVGQRGRDLRSYVARPKIKLYLCYFFHHKEHSLP